MISVPGHQLCYWTERGAAHPMSRKAKHWTYRFAVEKWKPFYLQSTLKETGKLWLKTQTPWWLLIRVFKGKGWGLGVLPAQRPFTSERVLVSSSGHVSLLWVREGEGLWLQTLLEIAVLSSPIVWLQDLWFRSVVSEKQLRILLETGQDRFELVLQLKLWRPLRAHSTVIIRWKILWNLLLPQL